MAAQNLKNYRYSISQLLEISARITTPFDLSRLSFNAVRAGIVPALTDCVMAPRESAIQPRSRGWSQQTSSASDEQIVIQDNRLEYPLRQPKNAPPGPSTQKDEGFAQFLKTHSSPNHTRVTAGGRIVPMEKRPAPPRFVLSASKANQNPSNAQKLIIEPVPKPVTHEMNRFVDYANSQSSPTKTNFFEYDIASTNALVPSTVAPGLLPPGNSTLNPQQAALESNIMMQNQILSYGQGLSSGTLYPAIIGMTSQASILGSQCPVNLPYLPCGASFVQANIASSGLPMAYDAEPHFQSLLQFRLNEANSNFEVYQQQLRDLDRHRATHQRDDTLVSQRVQIVARRAEIKEEIRRLQAAISLHESNQTLAAGSPQEWSLAGNHMQQHNVGCIPLSIKDPRPPKNATPKTKSSSKLNVAAAAYVPKASNLPSASELRMPNLSAAQYSRIDTDAGSPELKCVDGWNNRVGNPPAQLLREQSLLAEHLLSELNTPKVSDDDASDSGSAQSYQFAGSNVSPLDATQYAPPALQAECGRLLDAMRKPIGTITQVTLSDDRMQVVAGLGLKPPAAENMTDFERAYWNRKPLCSDYLSYGNEENSRVPSFTAKTSTLSFENSVLSRDQAKAYRGSLQDSPSRQALSELSAIIGYNPIPVASRSHDEWDAAIRKLQMQAASEASVQLNGSGPGYADDSLGQEALLNKTCSSTALQDIHATASLPRSLDGTVEATLLKMKGITPDAKKSSKSPKSPRSPFFLGFRRTFYNTK